jgi:hypothetical protein
MAAIGEVTGQAHQTLAREARIPHLRRHPDDEGAHCPLTNHVALPHAKRGQGKPGPTPASIERNKKGNQPGQQMHNDIEMCRKSLNGLTYTQTKHRKAQASSQDQDEQCIRLECG